MANDALGQELKVGQTVLFATSASSLLYKAKVHKICDKMVILNEEYGRRKFHEGVVIVPPKDTFVANHGGMDYAREVVTIE